MVNKLRQGKNNGWDDDCSSHRRNGRLEPLAAAYRVISLERSTTLGMTPRDAQTIRPLPQRFPSPKCTAVQAPDKKRLNLNHLSRHVSRDPRILHRTSTSSSPAGSPFATPPMLHPEHQGPVSTWYAFSPLLLYAICARLYSQILQGYAYPHVP